MQIPHAYFIFSIKEKRPLVLWFEENYEEFAREAILPAYKSYGRLPRIDPNYPAPTEEEIRKTDLSEMAFQNASDQT